MVNGGFPKPRNDGFEIVDMFTPRPNKPRPPNYLPNRRSNRFVGEEPPH